MADPEGTDPPSAASRRKLGAGARPPLENAPAAGDPATAATSGDTLMGEAAAPRDPGTGEAGTVNPRAAHPAGSARPTAVVPPKRGETPRLLLAGAAVVGIILLLLLLA